MIVYRLSKKEYSRDLSGKGSELYGGRWNSQGVPIVYTCESRALCLAEIAVNVQLVRVPKNYFIITIEIPDSSIYELEPNSYPKAWRSFPHMDATQKLGDRFVEMGKQLTFKVESAVIQDEYNYLINPKHKNFSRVKIKKVEPFGFDARMFA